MSTKKYSINALDELGSLDDKGKPVEARIKDVKSAIAIYEALRKADEKSSVNRARVDAMFDGASPYSQSQLNVSGQGLKTNLNFGEAQRLLDISLSAYVDLYTSLETLVEVRGTQGERSEIKVQEDIVAEEITHMLRCWPEFHNSYLRLCTTFVKHGTGVAYFDTPDDWKFRVGSFADILIPRQTPATEEAIDVAIGRRQYHLHELYNFIKNEKAATRVGWDVAEVKRVIMENTKTDGRNNRNATYADWETVQQELKNNDIHEGYQNPTVSILHYWVREMDGSVSHYICARDKPKQFLYKKVSRYEKPEQAYVMFTYGVGSNGTYHSIRGLGHRIFNHIQTSNRLRCQMIDGAMLGSAVMVQPDNQRALEELSFTYYGAYAVLSPNVNIVPKAVPNLSTAVQPALEDITNQLAQNTDTVSTYGPNQSSPYRNQMQVVADMDVQTRLSGASLNLFYASWSRLLKEIVRRVVVNNKRDMMTQDFYARCAMRGVSESFIKSLDVDRTKAVRSIGNGSYANRLVALRELQAISGSFDEVGRKNLTRDIVSTRVGHDLADRYIPQQLEERPTVDVKIAYFENQEIISGTRVPVVANELHATHLGVHLPALEQLIERINMGEVDPVQALASVQAFYDHISQTAQQLAGDPQQEGLLKQTKQVLNFAEEVIYNASKQVEKMQREQAEMQPAPEGQPPMDPAIASKLRESEIKNQITMEKAELDMRIKQAKFEQDQAIADAKNALEMREKA
jgi:predicted transcriptional regulator YdeE